MAAVALAEPPVPSSSYGVPSDSYGPPSFGSHTEAVIRPNGNGNGRRPSSSYGAPQKPNSQYGPPKPTYGVPNGGDEESVSNY